MKYFMMALCLSTMALFGADIVDPATNVSFPDKVTFEEQGKTYNLQATGVATRKKLIVKVYSVAHYLQDNAKGGDKFQRILNDEYAKQLSIVWARDLTAEQVKNGFKDSLDQAISENDRAATQADEDKFLALFDAPAKKGEAFSLRWLPGGIIQKVVDGKVVATMTNKVFARALWSIWFGDKSVVDRTKLISTLQ